MFLSHFLNSALRNSLTVHKSFFIQNFKLKNPIFLGTCVCKFWWKIFIQLVYQCSTIYIEINFTSRMLWKLCLLNLLPSIQTLVNFSGSYGDLQIDESSFICTKKQTRKDAWCRSLTWSSSIRGGNILHP